MNIPSVGGMQAILVLLKKREKKKEIQQQEPLCTSEIFSIEKADAELCRLLRWTWKTKLPNDIFQIFENAQGRQLMDHEVTLTWLEIVPSNPFECPDSEYVQLSTEKYTQKNSTMARKMPCPQYVLFVNNPTLWCATFYWCQTGFLGPDSWWRWRKMTIINRLKSLSCSHCWLNCC